MEFENYFYFAVLLRKANLKPRLGTNKGIFPQNGSEVTEKMLVTFEKTLRMCYSIGCTTHPKLTVIACYKFLEIKL